MDTSEFDTVQEDVSESIGFVPSKILSEPFRWNARPD
jgi:hypothetical protein